MNPPSERRIAVRHVAHFVAEIEIEGHSTGCSITRDASTVGFSLLTRKRMEVGQRLVLRMYVPEEPDPRVLNATVVRCDGLPVGQRDFWTHAVAVTIHAPPPDLDGLILRLSKRLPSEPPPSARPASEPPPSAPPSRVPPSAGRSRS